MSARVVRSTTIQRVTVVLALEDAEPRPQPYSSRADAVYRPHELTLAYSDAGGSWALVQSPRLSGPKLKRNGEESALIASEALHGGHVPSWVLSLASAHDPGVPS